MVWMSVPQSPSVKILAPGMALLESGETFREWDQVEGLYVTKDMPSKGVVGSLSLPPVFLCFPEMSRFSLPHAFQ